MNELAKPFVRAWSWIESVGGFPGQVFFVVVVIIAIFGIVTWVGNRR